MKWRKAVLVIYMQRTQFHFPILYLSVHPGSSAMLAEEESLWRGDQPWLMYYSPSVDA